MRRFFLIPALFILGIAGCSSNIPPGDNGPAGYAKIEFDSSTIVGTASYLVGHRSELDAGFNDSPRQPINGVTIYLSPLDSTGIFTVDTAGSRYISLGLDAPPFSLESDSGSIQIQSITGDSVVGIFSARMIGEDSTIHHLSGSFVAVASYRID